MRQRKRVRHRERLLTKDDYEVGYGRPPKANQFKPGQSGNPNGRPKKTKNLATDLKEELARPIQIVEGGKRRTVTKQQAFVKSVIAKAQQGDAKASQTLLQLMATHLRAEDSPAEDDLLTESDEEIIAEFLARNTQKLQTKRGKNE